MASVEFSVTGGSPRIVRTTNIPSFAAGTYCGWFKVTSYQDWLELLAIEGGDEFYVYLETNAGGDLDFIRRNGGGDVSSVKLWDDNYGGWFFFGVVWDSTNFHPYYRKSGETSLTSLGTLSPNSFTPTHISIGAYDLGGTPGGDGICRLAGIKLYARRLTEAQLLAESVYITPVDTSNLSFANNGQSAANIQVDQSDTGGDFTKTGTPTDNADSPPATDPFNILVPTFHYRLLD